MVASRKEPNAGAAPLPPPPLSSNSPSTVSVRPVVARPYSQLQLTIEPDCFILQSHTPASEDTGPTGTPHASADILRISFRTTDSNTKEAPTEPATEKATESEVKEQAEKEPIGLSAMSEEHPQRVSLISPDSYVRSEGAKDYIIYGCIGFLDLYSGKKHGRPQSSVEISPVRLAQLNRKLETDITNGYLLFVGPHFVAITSVKSLGNIEDKPVYAINRVAVLPMDAHEARQILDKLAQPIDSSLGPILNIEQDAELLAIQQSSLAPADIPGGQAVSPIPTKSPKFRLSFLGIKQDRDQQQQAVSPSPSLAEQLNQSSQSTGVVTDVAPAKSKRIAFDIPGSAPESKTEDLNKVIVGSKDAAAPAPPSSPPASPTRRSSPGFFAKLLEKKPRSKPTGVDLSSTVAVSDNPRQESVEGPALVITEQSPAEPTGKATEITTTVVKTERPPLSSRSPSTFEAAEKFMTESTKQLADWGEEAVSGVIKSTKSFTLMKTTPEPTETDPAHLTIDVTLDAAGVSEDELDRIRTMDRRIIREIVSIFGTGFYFSTEFNLLSSMQFRSDLAKSAPPNTEPLYRHVDERFWWNKHLLKELIDIKADGYILPVMQGYVEIEPCIIEEQSFEFTLISRRSRDRSGLRYQRRGIDEHGNAANFVETEQLLRIVRHDSDHQVSFVQTRGSIPLFWSQSPYRLKPVPVMERTEQENYQGFSNHFEMQQSRYGRQICINLVEQHGREQVAGSAYVEFDFHEQCKGMRYENIERLIKSLEGPIQELGYCWLAPRNEGAANNRKDGESWERLYDQKGVIRTNCMDCLDRTNVVQSAISRHVLNHQLLRLGIASFPDKGLSVYEEFENIFNHVWANNGDAISREYAGTSALKGDFTRTGKRNLQGMINDATNSVARMYQNTFKDYFRQAAIDYLLGSTDLDVFKNLQTTAFGTAVVPAPILPLQEPLEQEMSTANLLATDSTGVAVTGLLPSLIPHPSESLASLSSESSGPEVDSQEAWVKIREAAIESSAEIVISPGEEVWQGWTFVCCSNEISSALTSASSPQASPIQPLSTSLASMLKSSSMKSNSGTNSGTAGDASDTSSTVFYDEKVVLLTERALYICTYDYEMEKVLEFWRLALEKMTGIDKGTYFLTAQDKTPQGQNPLENYGFAVVYRANAGGETLRVNSGSVRNRRMMGMNRTPPTLGQLQEEDEYYTSAELNLEQVDSRSSGGGADLEEQNDDSRSAKSILKDEQKDIRSVRFKIVKHPGTSIVPYMTSSTTDPGQSNKANPSGYTRTAQDCVEWVVTEIIQARCELIAVSEGVSSPVSSSSSQQRMSRALEATPPGQVRSHHPRSPSEEYNYQSPRSKRRSSVQVDLMIRDRDLQSLEVAGQLEKDAMKESEEAEKKRKPKKPFSAFFSSSKTSSSSSLFRNEAVTATGGGSLLPPPSNNRSWLKKFQFGQDTDTESDDDEEGHHSRSRQRSPRPASVNAPVTTTVVTTTTSAAGAAAAQITEGQDFQAASASVSASAEESGRRRSSSQQRNSGQGAFAKFKQAVKNL
ncbi:hypothetical protein KI688_012323 [Linnemannia hyalina]|uniref:SAC domain-containing protein n=1 Tax=Linnemannia hyalina TaxID=64524 RepID=A0A9P8BSU7_9FUNG|nr:hypothetical protein KI688_012323 [Linnemannia hyalina]